MTTPAKTATKATASTKAKDAEILELQKQLSDYRQTIEEMAAKFDKLEIKQRLWVKEQKDGSLFTAGTTKAGAKKVTIYAAKSTKDANGKYVAGAWKALVLTDNGYGDLATQMQLALEEGERLFDFEMFEKTYATQDGRHNSWYMVTRLTQVETNRPAAAPEAPNASELPEI
jgi:TolA-binding protein